MPVEDSENIQEVVSAAQATARRLDEQLRQMHAEGVSPDSVEFQSAMSQYKLAQMVMEMPLASLGTCSEDGRNLRYKTRDGKLHLCCTGIPEHCFEL